MINLIHKYIGPNFLATAGLVIIFSLLLPHLAQAAKSADDPTGGVSGVVSEALACLTVGGNRPNTATGVVNLNWQGQAREARLVLKISGSEATHPIKVNGQPVAQTPIYAQGQGCGDGQYFELTIPAAAVVQGANRIEITNDAQPGDQWSAAYLRLYVLGQVAAAPSPPPSGQIEPSTITAAVSVLTINFSNSYDSSSQPAMAQIPDTYTGTPTPLVIAVHGRGSNMQWGIDTYGSAANAKGWLLASPQLHGSWSGPTPPPPDPPGAYAYASLESQYDVVGTVKYMVDHYNVKPDQIYLVGESMGSQTGTVVAAKYPHLFAAIFDNMGPTNMVTWYTEQLSYYGNNYAEAVYRMRLECGGDSQDPSQNPFCYQRRSSINFASNYIHVPISITHSISDALVPVHHSRDLRDAINSYNPDRSASVYEDTAQAAVCGPPYHCYQPDQNSVMNFFGAFTLNNNPSYINITSDESKTFYWLNLVKTSADQFSHVKVDVTCQAVVATISDTTTTQLGFNLGSTPITDIIAQPGLGLSAGQYLVSGGGNNQLVNYTSGYLNVNVSSVTIPYTVTISKPSGQILSCVYLPIMIKN